MSKIVTILNKILIGYLQNCFLQKKHVILFFVTFQTWSNNLSSCVFCVFIWYFIRPLLSKREWNSEKILKGGWSYTGLSPLGSFHLARNLFIPHSPNFYSHQKLISPSLNNPLHAKTKQKPSFLALFLLLYYFYLNFLLFVPTDYTNFDFNQCSIFTESCF